MENRLNNEVGKIEWFGHTDSQRQKRTLPSNWALCRSERAKGGWGGLGLMKIEPWKDPRAFEVDGQG